MLGKRVRKLRIARGMTQRELAGDRYTHAYVSSIESGRRTPSRDALGYLASRLGVDAEELVSGRPRDLLPRLEARLQLARIAASEGRLEEAERDLHEMSKRARRLPGLQARIEEALGWVLERNRDPSAALEHYRRAHELLEAEPASIKAHAVAGIARSLQSLGDVRYAIHLLESLLESMNRSGAMDPDALATVYSGLAHAYIEGGRYERAAEVAAELSRFSRGVSDPLPIARMHVDAAMLYLAESKVELAQRSLGRAEDAYREIQLRTGIGHAHLALGHVLTREGRLSEARRELESALETFEETGDGRGAARALNELARVERREGKLDRAKELLTRSIGTVGADAVPILARAHRELGLTIGQDEPDAAEEHLRRAIELYERGSMRSEAAVTYRELGDLFAAGRSPDAAADAYRMGILAAEPLH